MEIRHFQKGKRRSPLLAAAHKSAHTHTHLGKHKLRCDILTFAALAYSRIYLSWVFFISFVLSKAFEVNQVAKGSLEINFS